MTARMQEIHHAEAGDARALFFGTGCRTLGAEYLSHIVRGSCDCVENNGADDRKNHSALITNTRVRR